MAGEPNSVKWVGIRPTNPREAIPSQPYGDFGTQVVKDASIDNGTTIIHTVTAGTTLYLCSITFSMNPIAAGAGLMFVRNVADVLQYRFFQMRRLINDGFGVGTTFNPPLTIPAGYDVCIQSAAANVWVYGMIFGYEL